MLNKQFKNACLLFVIGFIFFGVYACEGGVDLPGPDDLPEPVYLTTALEGSYSGEEITTQFAVGDTTYIDTNAVSWVVTAVNDSTVLIDEGMGNSYALTLDQTGYGEITMATTYFTRRHFRNDSIIGYRRAGGLGQGWHYNAWLVKQ